MRVLSEIGRGGFSRVECVKDASGRIVARKTLDPSTEVLRVAGEEKLRKRFKREVRLQSQLPEDHFLEIYEFDLDAEHPWFTMPMADRNLAAEIAEFQLEPEKLTEPLAHLLNGLEILHSLGFVHRDVKPQNVLLHDGKWKLSDFGLAAPPIGATSLLTTNSAWGSAPYCPPEQTLDFHRVGPSGDVYAFGCILHDIYGDGPRVPHAEQTASEPIGVIIERCTRTDPKRRFDSITGLRAALFTALQSPVEQRPSADASNWVIEMGVIDRWKPPALRRFSGFLRTVEGNDLNSILVAADETFMNSLHTLDREVWEQISWMYCDWAHHDFSFAYCDVIGPRIERIWELADLSLKSAAAIAVAILAARHNRWFVMGIARRLAGPGLEENFALRLAIEIKATESERYFRDCSQREDYSDFHSRIQEAIRTD